MEGVGRLYQELGVTDPTLPVLDTFYADDTFLLSTDAIDMQVRFTLLETLAAQVGMTLNRDKTVLLLAKAWTKATLGTSVRAGANRLVTPMRVLYEDGTQVKSVEAAVYLGCQLSRSPPA